MQQKIHLLITCLLLNVFTFTQTSKDSSPGKINLLQLAFSSIKGKVFDDETKAKLSARVEISDDSGNVSHSYYKALHGFFTEEDGTFEEPLIPGNYTLTVFHGIDYESQKMPFTIKQDEGFNAKIYLRPWSPLKKKGWICGDGHDHLILSKVDWTIEMSPNERDSLWESFEKIFKVDAKTLRTKYSK